MLLRNFKSFLNKDVAKWWDFKFRTLIFEN